MLLVHVFVILNLRVEMYIPLRHIPKENTYVLFFVLRFYTLGNGQKVGYQFKLLSTRKVAQLIWLRQESVKTNKRLF